MKHPGGTATALAMVLAMGLAGRVDAGQQAPQKPKTTAAKKTAWGDPDLQGIWNHGTITPLERPAKYAGREFLTEKEIADINYESDHRADTEKRGDISIQTDVALAYNQFWWDRGKSVGRTSLIVDPKDGRLPALTPEAAQKDASAETKRIETVRRGDAHAAGPEEMDLGDRCILYRPVPITASGYNNNVHLVQSPGYVAILQEQIHDVRIIPLDGRPHIASGVRQWLGDSRGHFEGDTLVVETTNFSENTDYEGSSSGRTVIERFKRTDAGSLEYTYTITDPTRWTRSWTAMVPWSATEGPMFEYACHEGNHGMVGILKGSRAIERAAESKKGSN